MSKLRRVTPLRTATLSDQRPKADVVVEYKRSHPVAPKKLTLADLKRHSAARNTQITAPVSSLPSPKAESERTKTLKALGAFTRVPRHQPVDSAEPVAEEVFVKEECVVAEETPMVKPKAPVKVEAAPKKVKRASPRRPVRPEDLVVRIPVSSLAKLFSFATRILFSDGLSAIEEVEFMACVQEFVANAEPAPSKSRVERDMTVSYFVDGVSTDVDVRYVLEDLLSKCRASQKGLSESLSEKLKTLCN